MKDRSVWRTVPLTEVFWFQEGPGVRTTQFRSSGIKLLNVSNILKSGQIDLTNTARYLDPDEINSRYRHFLIDAGDLVIASSGVSFDTDGMLRTRGAFVAAKDLPLCMNTSTIRFKAIDGVSDLRYLRHWIDSQHFRRQITRLVTGTAQQNFGPSHLKAIEIPLPPLPEQRRIAAILDHADALRAKRRAAIAKLDSVAQSIFLDMFGDLLSQDHGFETATISECCEAVNDCPHSTPLWTATGVRCIRTSNLSAGDWDWTDERFVSEDTYHERSRRGYLSSGDIVLSREGTVGIAAIVPDNFMGCMGQRLVQLKPNPKRIDSQYLLTYLLSVLRPERIGQFMIGSTSQHLNVGELREIRVPLPPLFEQERFSHRRNRVLQLRLRQMQMAADMTTMMESLQHRAFQGTL
jgi:type I restriction enzyme S subunit